MTINPTHPVHPVITLYRKEHKFRTPDLEDF